MNYLNAQAGSEKHTNTELYHKQMELLECFRTRRAISQEQYDICVKALVEKMGPVISEGRNG